MRLSTYLYDGNVFWKSLFDILQPPERLSEGGEVRHHSPKATVRHKARENVPCFTMQQVELNVQVFTFLLGRDRRANLSSLILSPHTSNASLCFHCGARSTEVIGQRNKIPCDRHSSWNCVCYVILSGNITTDTLS